MKPPPTSSEASVTEPSELPYEWSSLVEQAEREDEAMHAASRPAASPLRRLGLLGRRHVPGAILILALAGGLFGLQRMWTPPTPTAVELDQGRRALLALINSSLEDHLRLHGDYPDDLQEVLPLQVDVAYTHTPKGYELVVRLSDGQILTAKKP